MTTYHDDCDRPTGAHEGPRLPDIYMPAMPPLRQTEAFGRWIGAVRRRRALRQLLKIDDRLLQDLGLTRARIHQAIKSRPTAVSDMNGNERCDESRRI